MTNSENSVRSFRKSNEFSFPTDLKNQTKALSRSARRTANQFIRFA